MNTNESIIDFAVAELEFEKKHIAFQKRLIENCLNNTEDENLNKKVLADCLYISSGFTDKEGLLRKIKLVSEKISEKELEYLNIMANNLVFEAENFKKNYSGSIIGNSITRSDERINNYKLAGVSVRAARGIWSDKGNAYSNISHTILKIIKDYMNIGNIDVLKQALSAIDFPKNTTINPVVTILNIINPSDFLLINGFILKGLKKFYKNITNEVFPKDINKDISVYLEVSKKLKDNLQLKKLFTDYPFFMVVDHYLSLIKDNYVIDMKYEWFEINITRFEKH